MQDVFATSKGAMDLDEAFTRLSDGGPVVMLQHNPWAHVVYIGANDADVVADIEKRFQGWLEMMQTASAHGPRIAGGILLTAVLDLSGVFRH